MHFDVSWQITVSATVQAARESIISSSLLLVTAPNKHEWTSETEHLTEINHVLCNQCFNRTKKIAIKQLESNNVTFASKTFNDHKRK